MIKDGRKFKVFSSRIVKGEVLNEFVGNISQGDDGIVAIDGITSDITFLSPRDILAFAERIKKSPLDIAVNLIKSSFLFKVDLVVE